MKGPGAEAFENEAMALFEQWLAEYPDDSAEDAERTEEEEQMLMHQSYAQWYDYLLEHASPLLREWCIYCNSRCGDEGELYDYDGSFIRNERGYPIQEWHISDDHRIVDEKGKQICYSNGEPILAQKMSTELFEYLKNDGWFGKAATKEDMWY